MSATPRLLVVLPFQTFARRFAAVPAVTPPLRRYCSTPTSYMSGEARTSTRRQGSRGSPPTGAIAANASTVRRDETVETDERQLGTSKR
jgi:hypothetical protein